MTNAEWIKIIATAISAAMVLTNGLLSHHAAMIKWDPSAKTALTQTKSILRFIRDASFPVAMFVAAMWVFGSEWWILEDEAVRIFIGVLLMLLGFFQPVWVIIKLHLEITSTIAKTVRVMLETDAIRKDTDREGVAE